MFTLIHFAILGVVVIAAVVAFKLWKARKAITAGAVIAGVKTDVAAVAPAVETAVAKVVADVTKSS